MLISLAVVPMSISNEERQRRIDLLEKENLAIKQLNDLSQIKSRVESEDSLVKQANIDDQLERTPLKKIANPKSEPTL